MVFLSLAVCCGWATFVGGNVGATPEFGGTAKLSRLLVGSALVGFSDFFNVSLAFKGLFECFSGTPAAVGLGNAFVGG